MAALLIWAEKNYTRTDMPCQWNKRRSTAEEETATKRVDVGPIVMWLGLDIGITKAIDAHELLVYRTWLAHE